MVLASLKLHLDVFCSTGPQTQTPRGPRIQHSAGKSDIYWALDVS